MSWIAQQATDPIEVDIKCGSTIKHEGFFKKGKRSDVRQTCPYFFGTLDTANYTIKQLMAIVGAVGHQTSFEYQLKKFNIPYKPVKLGRPKVQKPIPTEITEEVVLPTPIEQPAKLKRHRRSKVYDFGGVDTSKHTVAELMKMVGYTKTRTSFYYWLIRNNIPFRLVKGHAADTNAMPFDFTGIDTSVHTASELMAIVKTEPSRKAPVEQLLLEAPAPQLTQEEPATASSITAYPIAEAEDTTNQVDTYPTKGKHLFVDNQGKQYDFDQSKTIDDNLREILTANPYVELSVFEHLRTAKATVSITIKCYLGNETANEEQI